jgi:3-oxoacyl-[acyl-carrier protein] reductase
MQFGGKAAIVTGASRGIGQALCLALARDGADIACVDVLSMDETVKAVSETGRKCAPFAFDVSNPDAVEKGVGEILGTFEHLEFLVNNAGVTRDSLLVRMKNEDWSTVMRVNLDGAFFMSRAVIRHMMKKRSGRIVSISSVVGFMGNAGQANYAASKAGVVGFTKSLAREVASRGITVNAVAPGYIETDMTRAIPEAAREQLQAMIPMQRMGSVADIAGCVKFFLGDAASYITGQVLHVNGGMYM